MSATTLKRSMANLSAIADHWAGADETAVVLPDLASHWIGWAEPFCFACGWLAPVSDGPDSWSRTGVSGWLERAHLVDHCLGGSGEPANLVPLCHLCHEAMPSFSDRGAALSWVTARVGEMPEPQAWQMFTDFHGGGSNGGSSLRARTLRMRGDYLLLLRPGGGNDAA